MTDRLGRYARKNRSNPTKPEVRRWRHLSNRQLGGFKFRRQHAIDGCILDFFCPAIALGVEVDGHTHDPDADRLRDAHLLHHHRIEIIRFTNLDVMTNMEGVLLTILDHASTMPPRWLAAGVPHPDPVASKRCPASFRSCRGHDRLATPEGEGLL